MKNLLYLFVLFLATAADAQEDCVFEFHYADSYTEQIRTSIESGPIRLCYNNGDNSRLVFVDEQTHAIISLHSYACDLYSTVLTVNTSDTDASAGNVPEEELLISMVHVYEELIDAPSATAFIRSIADLKKNAEHIQYGENYSFIITYEDCLHGERITVSMTFN